MPRLDVVFNHRKAWQEMLRKAQQRVTVNIDEVEGVIEVARRTPGFAGYEDKFRQLSIFFATALNYPQQYPGGLSTLLDFWERYRDAVIQRYSGITPLELRAADKVVKDIFQLFLDKLPNECIAYSKDAAPLVYGGKGPPGNYFTNPSGWNRPFAIINLPHAAFNNVWQWLALPHETGHDTYATVQGLKDELEDALAGRMEEAVRNGDIEIPDITIDLKPFGVKDPKRYSGQEFIVNVWRCWADEAQADIFGILTCGAAAIIALQQIIGFGVIGAWRVTPGDNGFQDAPEAHPVAYIRNAMDIAALRLMSRDHEALADEIEARFESLRPDTRDITWYLADDAVLKVLGPDTQPDRLHLVKKFVAAKVPVKAMVKSAEIAAELILTHKLNCLKSRCYQDLIDFTGEDQIIVDDIADLLSMGCPIFAQDEHQIPRKPRHALAATIFAFEKNRKAAALINRTFKHFL